MASDNGVKNMISFSSSNRSSSSSEPQNRRKRCRICKQPSFQQPVSGDSIKGLEPKGSPSVIKNYDHKLQRKTVSVVQRNLRNACNSVVSSDNSLSPGCILPDLSGKSVGNEREEVYDISKEIDDAITRIESLIPSLQKLVNSVHTTNETSDSHSGRGESMLSKQVDQMLRESNDDLLKQMTLLQKEENPKMDHSELVNETMIVKPPSLQTPEHIQGLRIMPLTHTSLNYVGNSDCKLSQKTQTRGRLALEKGIQSQSDRSNIAGVSQSKVLQATSSGGVSPESGSCPSSSGIYETTSTNESDESEVEQREDESSQGYDTLSSYYYSSEEGRYSDTSQSSQGIKRGQHTERGKRAGKFRRFKNKLGKIFHHHHHHHHHHHIYDNDNEAGYVRSFWKRLGSVFHHTRKSDGEKKPKVENSRRKTMIKSVTIKKKQQEGGHFHALFEGLKRHLKHSKKPKDGIGRLQNSLRDTKSLRKQITWLPKRGGVKFPNKGRVKLGNRTRRPPLAAAKRMLT